MRIPFFVYSLYLRVRNFFFLLKNLHKKHPQQSGELEGETLEINQFQGDFVRYLRSIVESFQYYAKSKKIELQFQADWSELILSYDPEKVLMIFSKVLANSIKFMPYHGGIKIKVAKHKDAGKEVKVTIHEAAIGISKDKLPTIFDQFYQLVRFDDSSSSSRFVMIEKLVQQFGGQLIVKRKKDKRIDQVVLFPMTKKIDLIVEKEQSTLSPIQEYHIDALPYFHVNWKKEKGIGKEGKKEELFIKKTREIIAIHIMDYNFTVKQLCKEVGMSHTQFNRKITALTGYTPNKYIRSIRLKKAKKMLKKTKETIANIAYDTGFNDPAYFTRVFRKEFGVSPTVFRSDNK